MGNKMGVEDLDVNQRYVANDPCSFAPVPLNQPPVADAGEDKLVEATGRLMTVTLEARHFRTLWRTPNRARGPIHEPERKRRLV